MKKSQLRSALILPYVLLVVVLALAIGSLSYVAARDAVLTVSEHLLKETVRGISQAIDRHVVGSAATLEAAFPVGMAAPDSIDPAEEALRNRFWIATSIHIDPNNYVYYGNEAGQAIGLFRHSLQQGELRIKYKAEDHRKRYRIDGINGKPHYLSTEEKLFDPRLRPWYQMALESSHPIWTPVYIDFGTGELLTTRAQQVLNSRGEIEGVVATDITLKGLNDFLMGLDISPKGMAFIIEPDGNLIASSCSCNTQLNNSGENSRVNAADSEDELQQKVYLELLPFLARDLEGSAPTTFDFTDATGKDIHVAFNTFKDGAELKWINVVAMPREDFMGGISNNIYRTLFLGGMATIVVIIIGLWIMQWVTTDLRVLSLAVNRVSNGHTGQPIAIQRKDEIGDLAQSFSAMQRRLETDHLTGLPNRYAFEQYLQATIEKYQQQGEAGGIPFAILFIDLNNFKSINDRFGHNAGDQTLIELALRLKTSIRRDDFAARYAGDEFVLLLKSVGSTKDLQPIKRKIGRALSLPLETFGSLPVTISGAVGEAHFPEDADTGANLLLIADRNMYAHKAAIKEEQSDSSPHQQVE